MHWNQNWLKNLPTCKSPGPNKWLHRQILSNIYRRPNTYPSQTISKTCRGKKTPKFILAGHHDSDIKTRQTSQNFKNYGPISQMNIDAKIHNKVPANTAAKGAGDERNSGERTRRRMSRRRMSESPNTHSEMMEKFWGYCKNKTENQRQVA